MKTIFYKGKEREVSDKVAEILEQKGLLETKTNKQTDPTEGESKEEVKKTVRKRAAKK